MIFAVLIFGACTNTPESKNIGHLHETAHHDVNHGTLSEVIELNNGSKWKADPEMFSHVEAMKKSVSTFSGQSVEDYHVLAAELGDHTQQFISSCTMKGKGHDELHKWLHPYMQQVQELEKTENPETAEKLVAQLNQSLLRFEEYFK